MPPDWLRELMETLTACLEPVDPRAPIGCHHCEVKGIWEVTLFVSRTEILGGEFDGEQIPGRFTLDVAAVLLTLDVVEKCWWQPLPAGGDDEVGPHLSILGRHAGEAVWIRIPSEQPRALESGRVANIHTGLIENRW